MGTNYLQLPINAPKKRVATNQRDGQMAYEVNVAPGQNPHVNYEPSTLNGLKEAKQLGKEYQPQYNDKLVRQAIDRTNNFGQAGDTYRSFEEWEKTELISNLVDALKICQPQIQEKMIEHCTKADANYGRRLSEGLAEAKNEMMNEENNHTGSYEADKATDKAQKQGHEADPY